MSTISNLSKVLTYRQSSILSDSGGTCTNPDDAAQYSDCLIGKFLFALSHNTTNFLDVKRDLITATAAVAGIGSIMFGFLTNLPVALA
jgi:adenine/guanine/hypoxanthine permease